MKYIKDKTFPYERALYGEKNITLDNCRFEGEEDGESALKETKNVILLNSFMDLRYPLWHVDSLYMDQVTQTENCRASLWYSSNIKICNCSLLGIKALRECKKIKIYDTKIVSPEFGWKSSLITANNIDITSEYLFFEAKNIKLDNIKFKGKYSFQYVKDLEITNSILDTKDAFWHAKNVVVKDSIVKGEYLAWYSENVTFIRCKIIGTQPLCYCKKLKLIDCTTESCDLAFEYSEVNGNIIGSIDSIKNPLKGKIKVDEIKEILYTEDSKYKVKGKVIVNKN